MQSSERELVMTGTTLNIPSGTTLIQRILAQYYRIKLLFVHKHTWTGGITNVGSIALLFVPSIVTLTIEEVIIMTSRK